MQMRRFLGVALLTALVAGCANPQYVLHPTSNDDLRPARQLVDKVVDFVQPHPMRWGAYISPAKGRYFKPVDVLDSRNAMIYVYRPHSEWNAQEIQSPAFFIDKQFVFGLKDASYYWIEVPAGSYTLSAKRGLAFIYVKKIFETTINVEGGKNYYFRYDEEDVAPKRKKDAPAPEFVHAGPLRQMPEERGFQEVEGAVLVDPGVTLALEETSAWSPFELYADAADVSKEFIQESDTPIAEGRPADLGGTRRVWWNIFTW